MMSAGVSRGRELPRKTLHLSTAAVPFSLWYGVPQRTVAGLLVAAFGVACAVEFARRRSTAIAAQFDATVGSMLRPHEVSRGITGATWLLAAFALVTLMTPLPAAIAATWAGAVGDSTAGIVGTVWRRAHGGSGKSTAGTIGCLIATAIGAWWLGAFGIGAATLLGVVAAVVERPSLALDDNVRVTIGVALVAVVLLRI
jgi:dolichol kinase